MHLISFDENLKQICGGIIVLYILSFIYYFMVNYNDYIVGLPVVRGHWFYGLASVILPIGNDKKIHDKIMKYFDDCGPIFQSTAMRNLLIVIGDPKLAKISFERFRGKDILKVLQIHSITF